MVKIMNFFERQLWLQVVRRARSRAYGGVYFLVCICNRQTSTLARSMLFTKKVCLFVAVFDRVFSSLWRLLALNPNVTMYGSFSVLAVAVIHRVFCRLQSVFRISEKPISLY